MMLRAVTSIVMSVLLVAISASAQAAPKMGMVTGPKTGTYFAFGRDIAAQAEKEDISVVVKPSQGSIDNIKRINSTENAVLGIVQSDVLGFLGRSKNSESLRMAGSLRVVLPLYSEEVHVLARRGIASIADLQGKRVAVGEEGSGNMITATNIFYIMGVTPSESKKIPSAQGVLAVLKGDVDAVVFVGGKPVRLFKNLEDLAQPENQKYAAMLDQVHFLPLNDPKLLAEYKTATLSRSDYAFIEEDVPTVAVQALMVVYDFSLSRKSPQCAALGKMARSIRDNLSELKKTGHPKWKEVNLDADFGAWKKDVCAWKEYKEPKEAGAPAAAAKDVPAPAKDVVPAKDTAPAKDAAPAKDTAKEPAK